jgi:hypothetical protein
VTIDNAEMHWLSPVEINQPDLGAMILEGPAWHSDTMRPPIYNPALTIGQHTVEVAREPLGLDEAVIKELFETGVLESALIRVDSQARSE